MNKDTQSKNKKCQNYNIKLKLLIVWLKIGMNIIAKIQKKLENKKKKLGKIMQREKKKCKKLLIIMKLNWIEKINK